MTSKPSHQHGFGWVPDLPDHRDFRFSAPQAATVALPATVDLRPKMPPLYDQGRIGSCTAHAIAAAIEYRRAVAGAKADWVPSRLMIYYLEREAEGSIPLDNGAMIRTGIKAVSQSGACPEKTWPYDDTPADPTTWAFPKGAKATKKPSATAYHSAARYQALEYQRVTQTDAQVRGALAAGHPVIFGFTVYESLWDAGSGEPKAIVPMPGGRADRPAGGHAVLAVGYNDGPEPLPLGGGVDLPPQHYLVRNSWGPNVQAGGYFGLPYAYLRDSNLADDLWLITRIER